MVMIAVSQAPPVLLDLEASLQRGIAALNAAAQKGAGLVVFPEAFLPGYPTWIWRLRPGGDMALGNEIHALLRHNAVDISAGGLAPLCQAAANHGITVVCGLHEVDGTVSGSTLYNTVVVIGPDGTLLNRHRKLMPTNPARMVWGMGDASGLRVAATPSGRIGCLICWENYMPLARYALYGQNIDILIAPTWDCGELWQASMQHIAREGGCWVIATATAIQGSDVPASFPGRERLFPDEEEWINGGGALVVAPGGTVAAGPMMRDKGILYADVDPDAAPRARKSLDVAGHYARPDIFRLEVNRQPMSSVTLLD